MNALISTRYLHNLRAECAWLASWWNWTVESAKKRLSDIRKTKDYCQIDIVLANSARPMQIKLANELERIIY